LGVFGIAREALDLDIETRVAALEEAAEKSWATKMTVSPRMA